jgi:hypothetical protein
MSFAHTHLQRHQQLPDKRNATVTNRFKVGASNPRHPSGLGFLQSITETYGCIDCNNDLLLRKVIEITVARVAQSV